ncbi:MAG: hypothetical protein ABIR46_00090 [Candidatus Saccharimonadales bacterium]
MRQYLHRYRHYLTIQNATVLLAFVVTLGWVWGTVQTLQRNFTYQQQVDALEETLELESLRNENLRFQQTYFRSDEFLELSARQRLGKASPGEKLIILPDSRNIVDTVEPGDQAVTRNLPVSNLAQWLRFFFGRDTTS